MKVFLLCEDSLFVELVTEVFSDHELEFIWDAPTLMDLDHMRSVFARDHHDVVVLSNLGIPMNLAMQHVDLLHPTRAYGAHMLTGSLSDDHLRVCESHGVEAHLLPIEMATLSEVVHRLGSKTNEKSSLS